jgi:guanylate kinase
MPAQEALMQSFTSKRVARQVELGQYALRNRRAPTESEARLWEALRGRKLGVTFRRQVVLLDRYIVDFYAPKLRLVVEVDGGYHRLRKSADARRDRELHRAGYRVLRLPATLVVERLAAALERVRAVSCRSQARAADSNVRPWL